jgi:hypothetical protein
MAGPAEQESGAESRRVGWRSHCGSAPFTAHYYDSYLNWHGGAKSYWASPSLNPRVERKAQFVLIASAQGFARRGIVGRG